MQSNELKSSTHRRLVGEYTAAEFLGLSVKTLRRWRWAGKGPAFVKLGGAVRYDMVDLEAYVAASRYSSTSEVSVVAASKHDSLTSVLTPKGLELLRERQAASVPKAA